jgi:hypothetical protein
MTCSLDEGCCDFCKFFDFNGDEDGCYTDDGWCRKHSRKTDPGDLCADYRCDACDQNDPR